MEPACWGRFEKPLWHWMCRPEKMPAASTSHFRRHENCPAATGKPVFAAPILTCKVRASFCRSVGATCRIVLLQVEAPDLARAGEAFLTAPATGRNGWQTTPQNSCG